MTITREALMSRYAIRAARWAAVVTLAIGLSAPPALAADGGLVRNWNDLAFAAVRANNASDAQAARLYAMVNAAMYDAVNGTATVGMPRTRGDRDAAGPAAGRSRFRCRPGGARRPDGAVSVARRVLRRAAGGGHAGP